jgi:hypothetical protein
MHKQFVVFAVALAAGLSACAPGEIDPASRTVSTQVMSAVDADNAQFAAAETASPPNPAGRQTISVSFFVGHVGPPSNGSAHWTNTDSNDPDRFSMLLEIPEGGTPANGFTSFAGINFHHVPPVPPANPPSFDFKSDRSGSSGGSPRLVIVFSDLGNINLRPLAWVQNQWISEGPDPTPDPSAATNWDNQGGTCGFLFEQTYEAVRACHSAAVVTAAFIVSDSGWLQAPYKNWIDNIQYDGKITSRPSDNANH